MPSGTLSFIPQNLRQIPQWVMGGAAGAAVRLGLKRTTLQALVKRLGIDRPGSQANIAAPTHEPAGVPRHSAHAAQAETGRNLPASGD